VPNSASLFAPIGTWPVERVAAVAIGPDDTVYSFGNADEPFRLASVTKIITAYAALVAVEERTISLDEPAGPPGATVRHLLAHASGLPLNESRPIAEPGRRRIYSNTGINAVAGLIAERAQMPFADYLREGVAEPLGMVHFTLPAAPAWGGVASASDLLVFMRELRSPRLISNETLAEATRSQFPDLNGVLPGLGPQRPNPWGLGFELRGNKAPHWTGHTNSPRTFGHFGQSGTFLWVDPDARVACAVLTRTEFGAWAKAAWPPFSDSLRSALLAPVA
jgi:CubicO group peptidase (beta-lactamase class C family)